MLNHDSYPHSFVCPILLDLFAQNKLLKQHIVVLEQKVGLLKERIDERDQFDCVVEQKVNLLEERTDEHDQQIDYLVRKQKQNESVRDSYENRYYEWEFSENYYSLDGDANCNF